MGIHLLPFRTEKLSPIAPMVLHYSGRVGSRHLLYKARSIKFGRAFLCLYFFIDFVLEVALVISVDVE